MSSLNKKSYAVFEFDNFSTAGLKKFAAQLAQKDAAVASITATNRATKKDGLPTKRATFFFDNQQKAEITIGEKGDIITLKVNGKPQPTGSPANLASFAKHIAGVLTAAQPAFDKSLKRRLDKIKVDTPQKKPASRTNKVRIEEAKSLLAQAKKNLSQLRVTSNEQLEMLRTGKEKETQLQSEFSAEKTRNKELKATLAALTK
ncbi:hypothetical protein HWV00_20830 (plasmid) [Moritella sp. 24]|uniref:hypothetical protein n=1 Tax=Moritella sp. 24 TaxID=2746230 RepID=UPI001BA66A2A|nr:hypothetical protein [Moritella sp. 24]QUM78719.1 hypothetical protein HWV00_20830 [Moritella sp. 24]